MTDTSLSPGSQQGAQADADVPAYPSADLLNLIVAFLTPMFLGASSGDIRMARLAAIEMACAYRACSYVDLLTVAQLVAFSLTTLDSLSLSMGDDLSLSMILRLRGNANTLHRSAERHRCTLEASQKELASPRPATANPVQEVPCQPPLPASAFQPGDKPAEPKVSPPKAQPQTVPSSVPSPPAMPQGFRPSTGSVFSGVAEQKGGTPPCCLAPPRPVSLRAAALGSSANYLLSGAELPPPSVGGASIRPT